MSVSWDLTGNSSWTEWTGIMSVVVDEISSEQPWVYDSLNTTY